MTNTNVLPPSKRPALLWGLVCLVMAAALLILLPQSRLNSSVLAMLPKQVMGDIPPALNDGFMQRLDRQLVWLVSPGKEANPRVAQEWLTLLQKSAALGDVKGPMDAASQQSWGAFFWQHRNGLIDPDTRARLQNGGEAQAQWILSQLYSAFSGVSGKELQNDPLMLMRGSQLAMAKNGQRLRLMDGWLVTQDPQGNYWYLLHGELAGSSFDMQQTHQLITTLNTLEKDLKTRYPQAQLLSRGTVFYSDYASQQAKQDISTLGVATLLGVILLIVAVFRSLRPLLLCVISIGIGALAGTVATLLIFGELHLMTLVMSMSVIGISADYTLYYLTERMVHGNDVSPWQSLAKVRNALLLALLNSFKTLSEITYDVAALPENYKGMFETNEESADKWYQCKLAFITLDEKSGTEKRTTQSVMVQAAGLREAVKRLDEGMKSSIIDYSITAVTETKLMGVYHYQEAAPEGYTKVNKDNA